MSERSARVGDAVRRMWIAMAAATVAIATLFAPMFASVANAVDVYLDSAQVKVSFFTKANDTTTNSNMTNIQRSGLTTYASHALGGANVTQMSAIRVQFMMRRNPNAYLPYNARDSYIAGFGASYNANDPVRSMAAAGTSQWHLLYVSGPQIAAAWSFWNTGTDAAVLDRARNANNQKLPSTNAASVSIQDVTDSGSVEIAKDADNNVTGVTDTDVRWPGVFLLVETGAADPNKGSLPSSAGLRVTRMGLDANAQERAARDRLLHRASALYSAGNLAQIAAFRVQLVNKSTGLPLASPVGFHGSAYGTWNVKSLTYEGARSQWRVMRVTSPTNQWAWNTNGDAAWILNQASSPASTVTDVTDQVTLQRDASGNITRIDIAGIDRPAMYVLVEQGTRDSNKSDSGGDARPGDGGYYGYGEMTSSGIPQIVLSPTIPTSSDLTNSRMPAGSVPAFCYNMTYRVPYANIGFDGKIHGVLSYDRVGGDMGFYDMLTDKNLTRAPQPFGNRYRSAGSVEAKARLLKAWVTTVFYQAYSAEGIGARLKQQYGLDDAGLYRATSYALHRLQYGDTADEYLNNVANAQKNAGKELLDKAASVTSPDQMPSSSQIMVTLFHTTQRGSNGRPAQNLLSYRLPVLFDKVDPAGNRVAGADLQVRDASGAVAKDAISGEAQSWVSDGRSAHGAYLDPGEYTFHEDHAPEGYEAVHDVRLRVDNLGNVTDVATGDPQDRVDIRANLMSITDKPTSTPRYKVIVSKVDDSAAAVVGAELTLYRIQDGRRDEVARWTSDGGAHTVDNLLAGTYVLVETKVPDGYEQAADMTFTIGADASLGAGSTPQHVRFDAGNATVTMVDAKQPTWGGFTLRKRAADNHATSLNGAVFQLWKQDNTTLSMIPGTMIHARNVAQRTVRGDTTQFAELGEGVYYLVETQAPQGYVRLASPIKIELRRVGGSFVVSVLATGDVDGARPTNSIGIAQTLDIAGNAVASGTIVQVYNAKPKFTSLPLTGMSSGLVAWIIVGVFLALSAGATVLAVVVRRRGN